MMRHDDWLEWTFTLFVAAVCAVFISFCVFALAQGATHDLLIFADRMGWTPCADGPEIGGQCYRPDQRLPDCECVR
jgi:hypothetical protein